MSDTPVVPAPAPAAAASAPKTSIELMEQELVAWIREKEQMIENLKTINGAIQGAQRMLSLLRAEEAKAKAEAAKLAGEVKTEVEKVASDVEKAL